MSPKPTNVSFYLTAAAAHEAGLRACKRCLPDAVPGSPEWDLRDDLAARAMRLIADGVVEREGVPGLAARLGYTTRHLTRVLTAELGAGPLALSRAHRAQTARVLLTSTAMPAADVAFASGFGSVRQFNDTIREVYDRSPLELPGGAGSRARAGGASTPQCAPQPHPASCTCGFPPGLRSTLRACSPGSRHVRWPASSRPAPIASGARCGFRAGLLSSSSARAAMPTLRRSTSTPGSRASPTCRHSSPGCVACSISTPMRSPSTRCSAPTRCSPRRSRRYPASGSRLPRSPRARVPRAHRAAGLGEGRAHRALAARCRARRARRRRSPRCRRTRSRLRATGDRGRPDRGPARAVPDCRGHRRARRRGAAGAGRAHAHDRRRREATRLG